MNKNISTISIVLGFFVLLGIVTSAIPNTPAYYFYNSTGDIVASVDKLGHLNVTGNIETPLDVYIGGDIKCSDCIDDADVSDTLTASTWDGETDQADLNVNRSAYWDELDSPSDINAGDITDDNTYIAVGDNFGGDVSGTYDSISVIDTAGLTWGNISSGWNLNVGWTGLLGYGNLTTCGDDEILKMDGASWNCEAEAGGTQEQAQDWVLPSIGGEEGITYNYDDANNYSNITFDCSEVTDSAGDHLECSGEDLVVSDDFVKNTGDTMTGNLDMDANITMENSTLYRIEAADTSAHIYFKNDGSIVFYIGA